MEKYTAEALDIFMRLCEEFPELYDKYVEKAEKDLEMHRPEIKIGEGDKELVIEKIWSRIKSEEWE